MDQNNTTAATDYSVPLQIRYVVLGFVGMATNFAVMLVIFKTKELHNKSQYAIFCHALPEFLYAAGNFARGVQEIANFVNQWPLAMTQYQCFFLIIRQRSPANWSYSATMMLGIDRMLAVRFPVFYRAVNVAKYLLVFNLDAVSYGLEFLILGPLLTLPYASGTVAVCTAHAAYSPLHEEIASTVSQVVTWITVAAYVIALATVGYKNWGSKWASEAQKSEWATKVQLRAFKTIMIIITMYLFCRVAALLLGTLFNSSLVSPYVSAFAIPYVSSLQSINNISHFFVYLLSNTTFRAGFKNLFIRDKSNVVSSVQIPVHPYNSPRNQVHNYD